MPATGETVRVEGLRELQRAFARADKTLARELRVALRGVAEPVRADAERLAVERIARIGVPWSRMRVGVTQRTVYVAPRERGRRSRSRPKSRRPNLADLLMGRSMMPSLQENEPLIGVAMDNVLATVGRAWETG